MNIRHLHQYHNFPATSIYPLSLIILLSLLVTSVMGQEGKGGTDIEPAIFEDEFTASALNVKAVTSEVKIPTSKDSFIASNDPNTNFGSDTLMRLGYSTTGLGATRPLFKFDVAAYVPHDAKILQAQLYIYLTAIRGDNPGPSIFYAHNVTEAWDEGSVTWNNSPSYGLEISPGTMGMVPGWQVTDITIAAKDWLENPDQNRGVILISLERPDQNHERDFYTRESTSTGLTPYLYVIYDVYDDRAPITNVSQPSEGAWSPADFVVKWEGHDPPNSDGSPGSGIKWYDVYYTTNGGSNWNIARAQVTSTETNVNVAEHLLNLGLYARARDNAGNEGPEPLGSSSIQTWTQIDVEAPEASMKPLPEFTGSFSFPVSWQDTKELSESGIHHYDVQYREGSGSWQQLVYETTVTSVTFYKAINDTTFEFRARGVDNVGNEQEWGGNQASTTIMLQESYMPIVGGEE